MVVALLGRRVHPDGRPRRLLRLELVVASPVEGAVALEDLSDRPVGREDVGQDRREAPVAVGEHGPGTGAQEAGAVAVGSLVRGGLARQRPARLGVARRVAQVVEQDDRVRREIEPALHVRLAVVLDVPVAVARRPVEAHPVPPVSRERSVGARIAVAVAKVDEDVGALGGLLHLGPRGLRAVDLDDGRAVRARQRRVGLGVADVLGRAALDRPDHDHDLDRGRCDRGCRMGCEPAEGDDHGDDRERHEAHRSVA